MDKIPSNLIKSKMKFKEYDENLTELSLNNKLSRGGFSAVFFFKCMKALEIKVLREEEWR